MTNPTLYKEFRTEIINVIALLWAQTYVDKNHVDSVIFRQCKFINLKEILNFDGLKNRYQLGVY